MAALAVPERTGDAVAVLTARDLVPLTEAGLARLDAAAAMSDVDAELLHATPARDLAERLKTLVGSLRALDVDRVLKRQGWWDRLVGADLEARLELDVACRTLATTAEKTRHAASQARAAGSALWRTRQTLAADLARLDGVLAIAGAAAPAAREAEAQLRARFERRLANLMALQASSRLTLAQLGLAIDHLKGLIDRHAEVERLLIPLWQHSALAASHGAAGGAGGRTAGGETFEDLKRLQAGIISGAERAAQGANP